LILLQVLSTANVFLLFLSLAVILVSIIYGFFRGRASVSMLIACVVVFLLQMLSDVVGSPTIAWFILTNNITSALSIPLWMVYGVTSDVFFITGSFFAPLASIFLHGDISHIFFNMLFLFFIGMPLEQRVGSRNFMLVYLISGLVGSFCQYATGVPGIGASGALMGVFGAFAYLYPHERFVIFPLFIPVPASVLLVIYIAIDALYGISGAMTGIAHLAHVGGVLGGIAVAYFLKRGAYAGSPRTLTGRRRKPGIRIASAKKLNTYGLYTINSNLDMIQDAAREEIPEVKRAKIDGIVNSGTCPHCGSRPEIRGNSVVCRSCGYSFSLYE